MTPGHCSGGGGGRVCAQVEIENSFSNLQTKLAAFSRPPYVPPEGHSLEDINAAWQQLLASETA